MSNTPTPNLENCKVFLEEFYKKALESLNYGWIYFISVIVSTALTFIASIIYLANILGIVNRYRGISGNELLDLIISSAITYMVFIALLSLVVSIILYLFIRRTADMYRRYYSACRLVSSLLNRFPVSVSITCSPPATSYIRLHIYYIVLLILNTIFSPLATYHVIYNQLGGYRLLFPVIAFLSGLGLLVTVYMFFKSLNEYFYVEKASVVARLSILLYILSLLNSITNSAVIILTGFAVYVLYLSNMKYMLEEYEDRIMELYNELADGVKAVEAII